MSNHTTSRVCLGLALLLGTAFGRQHATATEPSAAVVAKYDTDSDKTLDWAEVQTAASARFDSLNKDADTTLDNRELKGIVGEAAFKAADSDHDGTLSKAEYLALVNRLFKQADANHDGTLDAQEQNRSQADAIDRLMIAGTAGSAR